MVVERTIGWFNRCRGIIIRHEKKAGTHFVVEERAQEFPDYDGGG